MGNPSDHVETPLTGGYLLIVLAEPRSAEHKLAILKKLTKGLSCWNYEESGVDIVSEFNAIVNQNIEGEEGKNGEQLFQYASDNLVAEILINPQHSTLVQCVRNLLASFTKYRCIIHAGYSFTENGSWILQDGSFSVIDLLDAYKTAEAQRTIRLHENQIRTELYCSGDADWNQVSRVKGTRVLINPAEKIVDNESIESIVRWLCDKIEVAELDILLEGSQVVGNIRFSRPTLYVFPAGQGDSALFGINGFNMLIDGGAGRNSCFWGFARHLDRLDAVLLTRLNSTNLEGVASFLKRKTMSSLYPQIGHFFCNFKTRKQISPPNVDAKQDILSISLIDTAQSIITDLKQLQLRPHLCYRNINLEPINLYHKVGHGKLDMYVLNPSKDSKEVKDFLAKWNEGDQKLFNPTKDLQFPLPNIISVCTLLVWQPANPNTTITRILFPGSSPQNKIFESLERVRHLDFLKHPSCSIKSMSSSTSVTVKSQTTKKTVLEKMIPGETKTVKTMENLEVSTSASNAVIQTAIIPTVPKEGTPKPKFTVETEKQKPNIKSVMKETANAKPKVDHKYSSIGAKVNSNKVVQKSSITKKSLKLSSKSPPTDKSSPTTPNENQEKITKPVKQVIKPKSTTTTTKSPSSTPTKNKKEEANRKVLVSSRTNSGLKRTQITKKETKPANPKLTETSLKKDSNIVYKSSLISCNKDKSGEEEDILIVEKVAITPEKLLTPDGKKLIANELDGILTTAKDIVTKEKLSDSGATTAPTMPEDEKITESKKEIEVSKSDKKNEEFKKAKDALKTPDEVADLPFHEEADEQKPKVSEKEIESEIETQEIIQVENAEYVLVSLDSSPEVLKRQVLDTVGLSDTELDEDSDKEDECVETKQSTILPDIDEKTKLIEHLLESSKDLCEITDKIDELKKQNEHEITNHQIHDHLQNHNHDNSKTSNICSKSNKQEKPTQIQEDVKFELQEKKLINEQHLEREITKEITIESQESKASSKANSVCDETVKSPVHETVPTANAVQSRSGSVTEHHSSILDNVNDMQKSKASSKASSICDEPVKSPVHETITTATSVSSRSGSITGEREITKEITIESQESKASSKANSVCDETVKSPVHETITTIDAVSSRSGSITGEREITKEITIECQESKASSKANSVCGESVKSPVRETITTDNAVQSRSGSIIDEPENISDNNIDMQKSKGSSKASSICDEPIKSPVLETKLEANAVQSRSGSIIDEPENISKNNIDTQKSKGSSKASSICDEPIKSPVLETKLAAKAVQSRSGSIIDEPENISDNIVDIPKSKASSKASSICDEPVKSPDHETITTDNAAQSRSGSIIDEPENISDNNIDMQKSKESSKASSICDEPVKSPDHEKVPTANAVQSRAGSVTEHHETGRHNVTDIQKSKVSSRASSVCDEPHKSPVHEKITTIGAVSSRSGSIIEEREITKEITIKSEESNASSEANLVCGESVKSPVHETITTDDAVQSRSGSIIDEPENISDNNIDMQKSKGSSKAISICDEPVKSPDHEKVPTANAVQSRAGSVTEHHESGRDNVTDIQKSKVSSRTSSVCDEPDKSPVHETITTIDAVSSRSGSIIEEREIPKEITIESQESKASSEANSVCDEPIKSPVLETKLAAKAVQSRSGSIIDEPENISDNIIDMQNSKASSKASSVCDVLVKSPVHETITTDNEVQSSSGSVTEHHGSIQDNVTDMQKSKASSKASSICDEPVKTPNHETVTTANAVQSRAGSVTEHHESGRDNVTDMQKSKVSSRASSVCDEPDKSPVHETITTATSVQGRSGSVTEHHESILDNVTDMQKSKASIKASSICDEPVKSPVHETITTATSVSSRSGSITGEREITKEITIESQESKASSKANSVCDETVKSPVHETVPTANAVQSRSGSVTEHHASILDNVNDMQKSKASSKASSIYDEPVKSPVHETITTATSVSSRSGSITGEREITKEITIESQESKASSKANSVCDETVKSPVHETITTIDAVSSRSGSVTEEREITNGITIENQESKVSSKANSVCDEPVKSPVHEKIISATSVSSRSGSITGEREITKEITIESQESKASSKANSVCDETVKSPVHETITTIDAVSSRSGSVTEEREITNGITIENQESKVSSKANSVCDEPVKSPVHEKIISATSVSSRSGSITGEREITKEITIESQESKASSKANSVCDETVKSPVHETVPTANAVQSRSGSVTGHHASILDNVNDMQKSIASSKASSICDEPVKSPVHETITTATSASSRSGSVTEHHESILDNVTDMQKSKASSKASSICDEPVKSPVHETITTATSVSSRSGSITGEREITKEITIESQESKASSKANSVCDETVKSPVHETVPTANAVQSRSGSVTEHHASILDNVNDMQKSKASSKASSICDEPVKSPVHETITTATSVSSRSGSITGEREITKEITIESQESKASSKANSVCDETVKSPVHETVPTANAVQSRSGSVTEHHASILDNVTDMQKSKASSKASSICDEPVKSPVHETITTATSVSSRSDSITGEREITKEITIESQESKASSKANSVCDETVKSPVHETVPTANSVQSRSGSVTEHHASILDNVNDMQKSKASSKASSICDEPVKSPVHETITTATSASSKSGSITDEQEITKEITIESQESKASSKANSVCDEPVKSSVHEISMLVNPITLTSSSITQEPKNLMGNQCSSKSNSISEEPLKSPELLIESNESESKSRQSSINLEQDITQVFYNEDPIHKEAIKILHQEKNSNVGVIFSRTNSGEELLESIPKSNNCSNVDDIPSNTSLKEQESISTLLTSANSSLNRDTEYTHIIGTNKQDVKQCSIKDSFCQDKNKSSTFSSSSTSSICQDIDTQFSKLSSRKSSVVDESSLQESNVYDHDNDNNYKILNKSGSLCDKMLNLSFNKVTENINLNKTNEQAVSPETTVGKTDSKIANKVELMCEESIKSHNDEICTKENLISSTSSSILHETEEEKCQIQSKNSEFDEPRHFITENTKTILSSSNCNKNKPIIIEKKTEESKSLGRIGSLCEEIAKYLTDNDSKISTNITSGLPCNLIESTPLKSNIEESEVETETFLQLNKNSDTENKIEKSLKLDDIVKVDEKHEKNTDHSLPVENITVYNKSPNISTILIEENNKTGKLNVAQMVGNNVSDESLIKYSVITDNETKNLKTVSQISNISSEKCISKLSNILIEDVVKTSDDKNIICDSSMTDICMNQPLGVTLNSEDLGVTKDTVMQLKRDVHEALHQCSSDDERPCTPHSESSMSRSAMNIDDDDDDNEDNKIETDDDMPGSPMSTGPSPVQMQLDNRHVEINMDFNKAMQEHRITRGEDLTNTEANGNHVTEIKTTEHDNINQNQGTSSDTVQSWGKPLGLPPIQSINNNGFDPIREWGKPLGLPSPTQPILELAEPQNMSIKTTPKKNVKKIIDNKPIINVMDKDTQNRIRRSESPSKLRSRSSSRMSRINPVYVDLIYVPHHGNSKYVSADFFKRVRARNYVFSGTDPSKEVLNALIEGKQTWEDQDLEVTIIPTYDTDTLGQWVAENEELLTKLKIDLSPSASRCTIKLQDHNTSCSAYRLEF